MADEALPAAAAAREVAPLLPRPQQYRRGQLEPGPGALAILTHLHKPERAYFRDADAAQRAGYAEGQRWYEVGADEGPVTWAEIEGYDGPIFLTYVPVV